MVKSNNEKPVHDETQGYENSPPVVNVGLDSGGFNGPGATDDEPEASYQDNSEQDEVFEEFSEVMDEPVEQKLEKDQEEVVTDGGQDVYGGKDYADSGGPTTDGGSPRMADVDHGGPYEEPPW